MDIQIDREFQRYAALEEREYFSQLDARSQEILDVEDIEIPMLAVEREGELVVLAGREATVDPAGSASQCGVRVATGGPRARLAGRERSVAGRLRGDSRVSGQLFEAVCADDKSPARVRHGFAVL